MNDSWNWPRLNRLYLAMALALIASVIRADTLPGFRVEVVAPSLAFCSALAADSHGVVYYATTKGDIYRIEDGVSVPIAHVVTTAIGNSGLLGLTLRDDDTAIVHYTTPGITADVISAIDLRTGAETVLHQFVCNIDAPSIGVDSEHHGGTVTLGDDGAMYVGIGDYGAPPTAEMPSWNGGKIFRVATDGSAAQLASGFRNPFGIAWDRIGRRLIVADNGDAVDDEIDVISTGGFYGWPLTAGLLPPVDGAVPPIYTFPQVVAPTGVVALNGANAMLSKGFLMSGFVSKAIYLVPDIDARPFPAPISIVSDVTAPIVSLAESPSGQIYFTTGSTIYRLIVPQRGDCNGDGFIDGADLRAMDAELMDGDPQPTLTAQNGAHAGSWGCDVNGDGVISYADREALMRLLTNRSRAVRKR